MKGNETYSDGPDSLLSSASVCNRFLVFGFGSVGGGGVAGLGDLRLRSREEFDDLFCIGGSALFISGSLLTWEGPPRAPKVCAKDGRDCGGCVAIWRRGDGEEQRQGGLSWMALGGVWRGNGEGRWWMVVEEEGGRGGREFGG